MAEVPNGTTHKFGIGTRITIDVREGVIDTFHNVRLVDDYYP